MDDNNNNHNKRLHSLENKCSNVFQLFLLLYAELLQFTGFIYRRNTADLATALPLCLSDRPRKENASGRSGKYKRKFLSTTASVKVYLNMQNAVQQQKQHKVFCYKYRC